MGFFSWNCKGCGKSIRSRYTEAGYENWMQHAVALSQNGSRIIGEYDGYGRIDAPGMYEEADIGQTPCLWHQACWEHAGTPEYDGPSESAEDQGYFIGPEVTLFPPNTTAERDQILYTKASGAQAYIEAVAAAADDLQLSGTAKTWLADLTGLLKAIADKNGETYFARIRAEREAERGEASS